jgi:hypothetical protein
VVCVSGVSVGNRIDIVWVSAGAEIMKITSSTSMTSTSGVMLICAIAESRDGAEYADAAIVVLPVRAVRPTPR